MKKIFVAIILIFYSCCALPATQPKIPFIIDTDVGPDDVMAILYLLKNPTVDVKAILVDCNASAHCPAGVNNVLGLLELAHYKNIPVARGQDHALGDGHFFPNQLRNEFDDLSVLKLPATKRRSIHLPASQLLIRTLQKSHHKMTVLAIGSLTTIAKALEEKPTIKAKIQRIYIMGGAVHVPGNITETKVKNHRAEWNIYIDPLAASRVFSSGVPITLVPLDVTNKLPVTLPFYRRLKAEQQSPIAKTVVTFLQHNQNLIRQKIWYFWDQLTAVVAVHPTLCRYKNEHLRVRLKPDSMLGAVVIARKTGHLIRVCYDVNTQKFKRLFIDGLNQH